MRFDQAGFDVRCEWGLPGLREIGPVSDVVIIVDILSFSTAVEIATGRGAVVFPYALTDRSAAAYADSLDANPASPDRRSGFSLSPSTLLSVPAGYRLVLPSPNGSALCFTAQCPHLLTACLRNASAAAAAAVRLGSTFALVPSGETWAGGEIRPCLEDLVGAGSIIARLPGRKSPEAELAAAPFAHFRGNLPAALQQCSAGKELIERGFAVDVDLAAEFDVSDNVPLLVDRAFRAGPGAPPVY